jgi:2,3-bisphosphoglycerate-dependent phosphoglycerate mutase
MKKLIIAILFGVFILQNAQAQTTKIWVIRHAEKNTSDPKDKDPELSDEGKERVAALTKLLRSQQIDTIYSTNYKRTKLTVWPLADKIGIAVNTYDAAEQEQLAKQILAQKPGKRFLIVGHSNTILNLVAAFGVQKPLKELTDDDYDYLFLVTLKNKKAELKVEQYGKPHRSLKKAN